LRIAVKVNRSHVLFAVIALVVATVWIRGFWFTEVFHTGKSNEPHRAALLRIRDAVAIGASHREVLAAYWQHRTDSLRLVAERPRDWIITTPLEFGATDWQLLIAFQDGKATTVRVRMSDGPPPKDGPKDKN
jgi:hypothetical protein